MSATKHLPLSRRKAADAMPEPNSTEHRPADGDAPGMTPEMGRLDDIESAVERLGPREFERFRVWFEELQASRFDRQIERDAKAGKLDAFADMAVAA